MNTENRTVSKLTKAELARDLNEALRTIEQLRLQLSIKDGEIAARDTRLTNAVDAYRALREQLPKPLVPRRAVGHVVGTYTRRDGAVIEKYVVNTHGHIGHRVATPVPAAAE